MTDREIAAETVDEDEEDFDDEEFCSRCFAGVDSSEHHEKCVVTGFAYDGETAWGRYRDHVWISNEA